MATARFKLSPRESADAMNAALHKYLISLESRTAGAELNGSPQVPRNSSRRGAGQVEFVNHPTAVSLSPMRKRACASGWGLGSSYRIE
jgi:hypothetical protein